MTVVVAGGMHDADTRGGLGHRRDWSPDPSACMGDAVEMDIASGVPGFSRLTFFLFIYLILKINKFLLRFVGEFDGEMPGYFYIFSYRYLS
ncbi:TPA: hypothetical protein ACLEX3_004511 [Pseudomonas aeruginosa]|nr:hypothetical protein [Pseudomonas aeruginosa]HEJ1202813.1 hypothetical protein [Pseudomonas aeruginosa]HEJ5393857.1 hypothetical protein [Pseudomonas aeruginosa]HEJ5398467.1 hypothetical protein [Pseudomonas aeruginosa]